jgi:hypothetical protein
MYVCVCAWAWMLKIRNDSKQIWHGASECYWEVSGRDNSSKLPEDQNSGVNTCCWLLTVNEDGRVFVQYRLEPIRIKFGK